MSAATIVFAGTPEFARGPLCTLVESNHKPVLVLTQPDRPAGRGKKMTASPVKLYAESQGIEVWQPATLRNAELIAKISDLSPDIMVVAAYGLILPQSILAVPKTGCLNIHASLLPRWRGAAPIQQAILQGDAQTGVCLMQMEAGLDTGPVFACARTEIDADETAGELHDRLARMGGELLADKIDDILAGNLSASAQDDSAATYAGKIMREDAAIDWHKDAADLHRHVRAYNPVPGAYFDLDGESIKCWRVEVIGGRNGQSGEILDSGRSDLVVACGTGALRLLNLQRPGRNRVTGAEFAAQMNLTGKRLG